MRTRALTLLEILIALGLVAFGLLTMIGVYLSGVNLLTRGEEITRATDVGRSFLDTVRLGGYAALPAGTAVFDGRIPDPQAAGFPPGPYPSAQNCHLVVRCEELDPRMKSVTVSVFYGPNSKVDLQTYLRP